VKPSDKRKVVVLLSGGIDSTTAFYDASKSYRLCAALSFDYGSRHNHRELPFAKLHCRRNEVEHRIVNLGFVGEHFKSSLLKSGEPVPDHDYDEKSMRSTVVPFRNGIMLSIAAGFAASCGAEGIVIAAHGGDHAIYPDCREAFMAPMARAIEAGTYEKIGLLRPFINHSKADIVRRGAELGIDFAETWSCYKGGETHCGVCGTCRERKKGFQSAGVEDPTLYCE